jgi:hypothetical protein
VLHIEFNELLNLFYWSRLIKAILPYVTASIHREHLASVDDERLVTILPLVQQYLQCDDIIKTDYLTTRYLGRPLALSGI